MVQRKQPVDSYDILFEGTKAAIPGQTEGLCLPVFWL